jgi:AbrB family looped-hinge helix DNA binding protein
MYMKRRVGEKGQIVIPKDVRDYLGLKPGSEVTLEVRGEELIIKPGVSPEKFVEEFVNVPKKLEKIDIDTLKRVLEEEHEVR